MSLPVVDPTAVATLALAGVMVATGSLAMAKKLGRYAQKADDLRAAFQGKDDQPGIIAEVRNYALAQTRIEQQLNAVNDTLHNGLEEKMENMGGKVDKMGVEFAELRGKVTMFIDMKQERGGKYASK